MELDKATEPEQKPLLQIQPSFWLDDVIVEPKAQPTGNGEKIQYLRCENEKCKAPDWQRPSVRGNRPKLCPPCQEEKAAAEPAATEQKMQHLKCENPECKAPNWSRPSTQGKAPRLCPECQPVKETVQHFKCENPECPAPDWSRPMNRGGAPKLCPTCLADKAADEEAALAARVQNLTCENEKCAAPEWTRPMARGKAPKLCPVCRAAAKGTNESDEENEEDDDDNTNPAKYDATVFSSISADELNKALVLLQAKYRRQTFYVKDNENILIRAKYRIRFSRDIVYQMMADAATVVAPPLVATVEAIA